MKNVAIDEKTSFSTSRINVPSAFRANVARWLDRSFFLLVVALKTMQYFQMATDKLNELFAMQRSLNARIGVHTEAMTDEEQVKWILNYTRALSQEVTELVDSVPWKWWAKYQTYNKQNARVEVVDMFHFLISLAQVLGMTAEDVFEAYRLKNEVNLSRQDTGYVIKDESDSAHI